MLSKCIHRIYTIYTHTPNCWHTICIAAPLNLVKNTPPAQRLFIAQLYCPFKHKLISHITLILFAITSLKWAFRTINSPPLSHRIAFKIRSPDFELNAIAVFSSVHCYGKSSPNVLLPDARNRVYGVFETVASIANAFALKPEAKPNPRQPICQYQTPIGTQTLNATPWQYKMP